MSYFVAVDLGTTTVELAIVNSDGEILIREGYLNPEKRFGSDVISRITNSNKGYRDELKKLINESISDKTCELASKLKLNIRDIAAILISGNTVMNSIFLGYDLAELGRAPFKMPFESVVTTELNGIKTYVLPGASAFLGADIISGVNYLKLNDGDVLMDLGTNGEMVVKNAGAYYATTAACGPAFENCTRAKGIYGSTTLEHIANLLLRRIINPELTFTEDQINSGITSTVRGQSMTLGVDVIRSISVAVAAIYSSLLMLLSRAKLDILDVKNLYIAGGFGFYVKLNNCQKIGLLPKELSDKAIISKNTSLLGAIKILMNLDTELDSFEEIRKQITVYQFGGEKEYEELFLSSLILKER